MTIGTALLHAKSIGIRNFRDKISQLIKKHQIFIVTEHGSPASVLLPYEDMLEIVDILDELKDRRALKIIAEGRRAIRRGTKGILASKVFTKKEAA